ncbi:MAG: hypothetical protein DCC75_01665 [Proteobacteria bacterium]|nr:MAG: hypothetical protein DCC75_01665 [Pseudomonadota bacterium]
MYQAMSMPPTGVELSPGDRLAQLVETLPELTQEKILAAPPASLPPIWLKSNTGAKILSADVPENLDPNTTVVLGGICSLFTGDGERVRKREEQFATPGQFENWMRLWYPRLDQIHNTVGIPPRSAKQVVYVCEDSIWARRIEKWTGLPQEDIAGILKELHQERGERILERWFKEGGYSGPVRVVYTSDIEPALCAAREIWQRLLGQPFDPRKTDQAAVNLMYTSLWLDVLGIKGKAAVYEDVCHGLEIQDFPQLRRWIAANPYGRPGINSDFGVIGFMPFCNGRGVTRGLPCDLVPNFSNWHTFRVADEDAFAYGINLLAKDIFKRDSDKRLTTSQIKDRAATDIARIYEGI